MVPKICIAPSHSRSLPGTDWPVQFYGLSTLPLRSLTALYGGSPMREGRLLGRETNEQQQKQKYDLALETRALLALWNLRVTPSLAFFL